MAAGDLQREIAPKENAGHGASLPRVEIQIMADARKREGDVSAVDEGDGVHDQRDGDDAGPASWGELGGGWSGHCVGAHHRSEEHTSELQSLTNLVCRLLLEKKKKTQERHKYGERLYRNKRDIILQASEAKFMGGAIRVIEGHRCGGRYVCDRLRDRNRRVDR